MDPIGQLLAFGLWPALPLTGYWLLRGVLQTHCLKPLPRITALALTSVIGITVWSGAMLGATIAGVYRAEYFGGMGWAVSLLILIQLLKQQNVRSQLRLRLSTWDWILIAGLALTAWFYLGFPTESIEGGRDQGVYASHGIYIAHHGRLEVPYPWQKDANSIFSEEFQEFLGFYKTQPTMTVQFAHLLPVWLAQAFATFEHYGLFRLNAVLALLSMCMFYGLCRTLVPKPYAVIATLFLALNPGQIWLARITLTEMFAQLFIVSGLFLLLHALRANNSLLARWAGVCLGYSAFVRVDSFLLVPCLFLLHLTLKFVEAPAVGKSSAIWPALYQGALPGFTLAVGYYAVLSRPYFLVVTPQLRLIGFASAMSCVMLVGATPGVLQRLRPWVTAKTMWILFGIVVGMLAYAYWIRPGIEPYATWSWPEHPIDGTRTYREDSLVNLTRYLSPFIICAAVFGWCFGLYQLVIKKENLHLAGGLVIVGEVTGVFLWDPSVTPDHFWAIRRFIPVVIPGFVFFAAFGVWWALGKFSKSGALAVGVPLLGFLLIFLIRADAVLFAFAENKGLFEQLQQLAERLPRGEIIVAHDAGGWSTWTTPLYIAFDRQIVPLKVHTEQGKKAFNKWVAQQVAQRKPVFFLHEGEPLVLCGFEAIQLDKIVLSQSYVKSTIKPLPREIESRRTPIVLYKITGKGEGPDYGTVNLGARVVSGVQQEGLDLQEWTSDGQPIRWTNGQAKLVVPLNEECLPKALKIDLASTGPNGTQLRVLVNGHQLFNERVSPLGWSRIFNLTGILQGEVVTIEIISDTFVPREVIKGSIDPRNLGVLVQDVSLLECDVPTCFPVKSVLGGSLGEDLH